MNLRPIICTRGGLPPADIAVVVNSLAVLGVEPLVWNNSRTPLDLKCMGTFVACAQLPDDAVVFYQDDDVVIDDPIDIIAAWEPGRIACNVPAEFQHAYRDAPETLIGFGSVWEASLVRSTFARYREWWPLDDITLREAHRIFTGLNQDRILLVDTPKTNMPYASAPDRLWKQRDHGGAVKEARRRIAFVLAEEKRLELGVAK